MAVMRRSPTMAVWMGMLRNIVARSIVVVNDGVGDDDGNGG